MSEPTDRPTNSTVRSALVDIARHGGNAAWEVFHDPRTGRLRFLNREDPDHSPPPGSVPVQSIASTAFAAAW